MWCKHCPRKNNNQTVQWEVTPSNAMMPLSGSFFLFSPDATLQKFFKISCQPHNATFWILEIMAAGWHKALCCMRCKHCPKKQSNCAVGGNPKPIPWCHSLEVYLFSPDAILKKSHANLTMPLCRYWKLWLLVSTEIELAALHWMQSNLHPRKKQQSNCAAGGNPKFLEIGNHGCQSACGIELYMLPGSGVTWQHLWQHPENITVVPYGDVCTWQLRAKLHVFWSTTIINQSCHLSIFRTI